MSEQSTSGTYRVFCAYGPAYRAPGCGWERFADSEEEAERLVQRHEEGRKCVADYGRSVEPDTEQSEGER